MAEQQFTTRLGEIAHTADRPENPGTNIQDTMEQALPWSQRARGWASSNSWGVGVSVLALVAAGAAGYFWWRSSREEHFGESY